MFLALGVECPAHLRAEGPVVSKASEGEGDQLTAAARKRAAVAPARERRGLRAGQRRLAAVQAAVRNILTERGKLEEQLAAIDQELSPYKNQLYKMAKIEKVSRRLFDDPGENLRSILQQEYKRR